MFSLLENNLQGEDHVQPNKVCAVPRRPPPAKPSVYELLSPATMSASDPPRSMGASLKDSTKNQYDDITLRDGSRDDEHHYERITEIQEKVVASRLLSIEMKVDTLQKAVDDLKRSLKEVSDSIILKFQETADHLGQQVFDVRKDIQAAATKKDGALGSAAPEIPQRVGRQPSVPRDHRHSFEWEIQGVDSLVRSQGKVSSASYHIGQIDYKLIGSADFTKDNRMHLKMFGDSTSGQNLSTTRSGQMECQISVCDRNGGKADLEVGKVVADFNSLFRDKNWMAGIVSVSDLKKKGFCSNHGTITLRFSIHVQEL